MSGETNPIDAQAADWAARLDGATLGPADAARLDAWLAADVRHVGAFARAQALLVAYEDMQTPAAPILTTRPGARPGIERRHLLWGGGIAAGLAAAGLGVGLFAAPSTAYATGRGETRVVDLGGGGRVALDALTRIAVSERLGRTTIELIQGGVLLEGGGTVRLECAGAGMTAVDGVIGLTTTDEGGALVVREGRLTADGGVVVGADHGARIRDGRIETPRVLSKDDIARALAWRTGMIAFEGATLAEAADAFARYSLIPIHIADASAGRRRVSGLFKADDPVGFARAIAITSGLDVAETEQGVTLSTPNG